jgi:hypothetical protein
MITDGSIVKFKSNQPCIEIKLKISSDAGMPKTNETTGWLDFGPLVSFLSGPSSSPPLQALLRLLL